MASKKKAPAKKSKPKMAPKKAAKPAPKKSAPKVTPKKSAAKPAPKKTAKPASKPSAKPSLAERMAAFSQQVVEEEAAPVAVRTFNEARAGVEESKQLNVQTGQVSPSHPATPEEEEDEELAEFEEEDDDEEGTPVPTFKPSAKPQMEPLTGPLAVPKRKDDTEFQIAPPASKKKGAAPTKEDLGKIELRMQRGTKDATIGHANPDYLQRSFNKAAQTGKTTAMGSQRETSKSREDEFQVAQDKPATKFDASLMEFGDVEIAQQTRKGKRTLGKLDTDEEEKS